MADARTPLDPVQAAEQVVQEVMAGLMRIERARARVRPEDWATLFRQMHTILLQLATHPFVKGDLEAETLIAAVLGADDFEEVDRRVDAFAEYALKKLQFNAALKEAITGVKQDVPQHLTARNTTTEVTRAASAHGPSGSDFQIVTGGAGDDPAPGDPAAPRDPAAPQPPKRRGVLRL